MTYSLSFTKLSLKEWEKLDNSIKLQFKSKLKQRLKNPKIAKDRLVGFENIYKIKLKKIGYRLAYEVKDDEIIILVLNVGKRENNQIYKNLINRKNNGNTTSN